MLIIPLIVATGVSCWFVFARHRKREIPLCDARSGTYWYWGPPLTYTLDVTELKATTWADLRQRFGTMNITDEFNDKALVHEDTSEFYEEGELHTFDTLADFIDAAESGRHFRQNYIKLVDVSADDGDDLTELGIEAMQPFFADIETGMSRAMADAKWPPPTSLTPDGGAPLDTRDRLTFSLWLGGNGSTTSMHVDDQSFNVIMVLSGSKRVVLLPPDAQSFLCVRPTSTACWTGVDLLQHPPANLRDSLQEVILWPGDALLIPEDWWHAVENLGPTIAVGLNNMRPCTGRRFSRLGCGNRCENIRLAPPPLQARAHDLASSAKELVVNE